MVLIHKFKVFPGILNLQRKIMFRIVLRLNVLYYFFGLLKISNSRLVGLADSLSPSANYSSGQTTQSPLVQGFALALDVKVICDILQPSMVFSIKW